MISSILNRKDQQFKVATRTLAQHLNSSCYIGGNITQKLFIMFDKIGFSCGIQAFKFISFKTTSFTPQRKTRSPILENAIS